MDMPFFSIIVPVYDVEKYVEECIVSILNQIYRNFELIMVDDGSDDASGDICDRYMALDRRVKVIHQQNRGVVVARQNGVQISKGKYLLFVDSDDYIEDNCLLKLYSCINECENVDVVVFVFNEFSEKEKWVYDVCIPQGIYDRKNIQKIIFPKLIEDEMGKKWSVCVCGVTFKRSLYAVSQLMDCKVSVGEDMACSNSCIMKARLLVSINEPLYCYRMNPNSVTRRKSVYEVYGPKAIGMHLEKQADNIVDYDFKDQIYRNVVHNLFVVVESLFYSNQPYNKTKKYILKILNDGYYRRAVKEARFAMYSKGNAARIILDKKAIMVIYCISRIRKLSCLTWR